MSCLANFCELGSIFYNVVVILVGLFLLIIAKDLLALTNMHFPQKIFILWLSFLYVFWLFWGSRQGLFFWLNAFLLIVFFILILLFFVIALKHYSLKYLFNRIARIRWLIKTLMYNDGIVKKNYPSKFNLFLCDIKAELKHLCHSSSGLRKVDFLEKPFAIVTYREYVNLMWEIFVNNAYYLPLEIEPQFIIDGGSNIGVSILFFKTLYPQAKILGFEPNSENFATLSDNVCNRKWDKVSIENKAIYNVEGICKFDASSSTSGQINSIEYTNSEKIIELPCVCLSSYINKPVDILKLDIEGVETVVIEELDKTDKLDFIKNMLIEFHYGENKENNKLSLLLNILENNNFNYQIGGRKIGAFDSKCENYDILIYAYKKISNKQKLKN